MVDYIGRNVCESTLSTLSDIGGNPSGNIWESLANHMKTDREDSSSLSPFHHHTA